MRTLPGAVRMVRAPFAPLFSTRRFAHASLLVIGTLLAPGRRTVAAAIRVLGRETSGQFQSYPQVLSRARWCTCHGCQRTQRSDSQHPPCLF